MGNKITEQQPRKEKEKAAGEDWSRRNYSEGNKHHVSQVSVLRLRETGNHPVIKAEFRLIQSKCECLAKTVPIWHASLQAKGFCSAPKAVAYYSL